MDEKTCIMVTGVGGRSVGHQILQALLLLGEKYQVVATDADSFSFGLYQVPQRYIVPKANDPNFISAIISLIRKMNVRALLPGTEVEVNVLTKHRSDIEASGCLLIANPEDVVKICSNKWRLFQWFRGNGIETPRTTSVDNWEDLISETGFPIVGKPAENSGGSRNVEILKDRKEIIHYLEESKGSEVIFQEYVGVAAHEYTVGVIISKAGNVIDSIVVQRKLTGLSLASERMINGHLFKLSSGYSQGFIIKHPLIQNYCENLAMKFGMRGPVNIQCRLIDDRIKVFEVHPRFSGTTSIRAMAGFNEPDILIRNYLFDESFGRLNYQTNVAAIRAFQNMLVPISEINNVSKA
jgi:carbamoyl-phosphate synthase large subunit